MSLRFWIAGAGVVIISTIAGFGLGGYAGGRSHGGPWEDHATVEDMPLADKPVGDDFAQSMPPQIVGQVPEPIICKGCGPTLAERNMTADAYAAGGSDAMLLEYQAERADVDAPVDAPAPKVVATILDEIPATGPVSVTQ